MHIKNVALQAFATLLDVLGGEEQNLDIRLALYCFHWGRTVFINPGAKPQDPSCGKHHSRES